MPMIIPEMDGEKNFKFLCVGVWIHEWMDGWMYPNG